MVSTMSAELVSLPFLHEPKVYTAPRALMVCNKRTSLTSLFALRLKSPLAFAHLTSLYNFACGLLVFTFCATLKVLCLLARPKSPRALALKGLALNETTAQSRDCAVAA